MSASNRRYVQFNPEKGYAAGPKRHYECFACGQSIPSQPVKSGGCRCENVCIDIDAGRLDMRNPDQVRLYELG